ncbi:MAG: ABC transporter permease [Bacteroidota bacterium]|nr:ABC transporter permease [Bacteroidota bacterium]MDP4218733.1 ABC transporter permease [Bacteroidota bacterium]MDP4246287.1 ABC transporter permease [Bacteroidota bacterium]MDP4253247.1 ABC transporter permease [Bacteroidota bacterium]MDP4259890.1 ABC transporter permease [Bacteroidota bacterium]
MLRNYFKTAIRTLLRNKVFSIINVAGLSIGLACAMLIMLYVKDEVSYDRFHAGVRHIYRIYSQVIRENAQITGSDGNSSPQQVQKMGITGLLQGPRFTKQVPGIKAFVRVRGGNVDIRTGTEVRSQNVSYVDPNFFSVFTFPLLGGNPGTCLLEPHSVVISEDVAIRQFGTTNAVGRMIMIRDHESFIPCSVTAVARRCPQNSSIKFDVLLPFIVTPSQENEAIAWFNFFLETYVVLDPAANVRQVEAKMQAAYKKDAQAAARMLQEKFGVADHTSYALQPFIDMHLDKDLPAQSEASNPIYSYILSGIALFVLLIACINFINLTVARSLKRAKEIGIRKVVGGSRRQLIAQFLGESFLLCLAAFLLAIGLVRVLLPLFNQLSNKALALSYLLDSKLVAGYTVLFILTGLLAGFYPAMILSGYDPVKTLYHRLAFSGKNYLQKGLVVLQFTMASFLILATLVIYSQFNYLTTKKLGYDDSHLVLVSKQYIDIQQVRLFKEALMKNPGIANVAARDEGYGFTAAKVNGDSTIQFAIEIVDEGYLPMLKIPIVQGRNFSTDFPSDSAQSILVNESFVRRAGWRQPIGQLVNFWYNDNRKFRVVGVMKDYHFQSLNQVIGPELVKMSAANEYGTFYIKLRPNNETAALRAIEGAFRKLFPISPYRYVFKDQENLKEYESEAKWKQIMFFGALLTIFISCIGLFGLSVMSAEKRTREIGIRKVLGASVNSVVTILSRDFLKLVIISLALAMPAAWIVAGKWLQNYPYRISMSWQLFALAGLLVTAIAFVTVSFQAIKAAVANPVNSLRSE